jgi:lipopolysaccharide biosynthesis regulator YciM
LKDTSFALPALRALIRIYESEHDWARAIHAVESLRKLVDEPVPQLVHYHCEQAQVALASKPPLVAQAQEALQQAERAAKASGAGSGSAASVRVALIHASIAGSAQQTLSQRQYLQTVLQQSPEFAGLVAEQLLQNFSQTQESAQGLALLLSHHEQYPSLDLFNVVFRALRAQQGVDVAWAFARRALQAHPSLLGLDRLLEAELAHASENQTPLESPIPGADLALLRRLINKHSQRLDRYTCRSCGFQARRYYWQCPGCNAWETYKPRRMEELG